jgi:flagellar hook-basal body complex protein FliE
VMLTMSKAKSDVRMLVEVRNKLLEGYQELLRMQV